MSQYQTLSFEQSGPIARIVLNRPDAANGMNDVMTRELADVARCCDTADTKAVVLTGVGRFFCAGGDLKAMTASPLGPGPFVKGIADDLHRAISTFARMDAVLITAVNGVAAGAGFSLAVTGDLVLAADSASFTMAYTRAGPESRRQFVVLPATAHRHPQNPGADADQPNAEGGRGCGLGSGHRGRAGR